MKARVLLVAALAAGLASRADSQEHADGERRPPNVLLLMSDDQGWGDAGYRGHARLRTPQLDRLARSGLSLERFYAAAPVCSPTRASVLTGRHPARMGIDGANVGHLPRVEHTLAELLRERGYATGFFGKWHLGTLTRDVRDSNRGGRPREVAHYSPPWEHGFEVVFATEAKVPTFDPLVDPETGASYGTAYWNERGERVTEGLAGDDSRVIVDRVVPFLRVAADEARPFLAVVWFHAPHEPVVAGPEHLARYADVADLEERAYYACLAALDDQVGRLLDELEALELREDTLVWFCSDNGPEHRDGPGSTGGLRGRKRDLWEGGVRVPGILSWPRAVPPGVSEVPTSTLDILPTVSRAVGVTPDPRRELDGRDILEAAGEPLHSRPLPFRAGKRRALTRGDEKLVSEDGERWELHDLAADPAEARDLAPEHPGRVDALREELARWEASVERSRRGLDYPVLQGLDPTAPRPHVLLVMADDLGVEWLSCYGGEGASTPNLDALAAGGTRFTRAWSMPKCTPSRVTLLTGQYPFRHGWVDHWDVPRWGAGCHFDPAEYRTLPEVLSAAGYRSVAAGKWQVTDFRLGSLAEHHFDAWCMWTGYEEGVPASAARYDDPYVHEPGAGSRTLAGRFGPDVFTDFLVARLAEAGEAPLFLYYPMVLPHGPLIATPAEPEARSGQERFAAMVRYVDHCVGRLVAALEEHGLREDTLIVFTADNGSARGITGRREGRDVRGGKGTLAETGCHVPWIVSWPGRVPEGRTCDAPTDLTDLLPTLAELAGARLADHVVLDGASQAAQWLGAPDAPRRPWVLTMGGGVARHTEAGVVPAREYADRALCDGRFKLWVEGGVPTRLYDLSRDPAEEEDLFESEEPDAHAARVRLEAMLRALPARDAAPRYTPATGAPR